MTTSPDPAAALAAPAALAPHEQLRLDSLETTVGDGLRDFQRTGQALGEIRDNGLYRATYATFEAYLTDRWGFTLPQAGRLMDAADVAKVLSPIGIQPQNERQARALKSAAKVITELEPEQQRVVARLVEGAATDVPWEAPPDAAELRIAANVVRRLTPDATVYHPDSGDEVPFETLSAPQRFEVTRTQVEQKTQAHREKQEAKANAPQPEKVNWAEWCMEYAQHLTGGQRLEVVIGPGGGAQARIMDHDTGEVLLEGAESPNLKRAVMSLVRQLSR